MKKLSQREGHVSSKNQRGATLVVALVLLAAVTIIGMSNMQSSSLEMKMVTSTSERNEAFVLAEGALLEAESLLEGGFINNDDLFTNTCTDRCFTDSCAGGLCFDGSYESGDTRYECQVAPDAGTSERVFFWRDDTIDVWSNAARYRTVNVSGTDVKYIFEFLCFVDDGSGTFGSSSVDLDETAGKPLFRVTALAGDGTSLAPVMLQTTYVPSSF